MESFLVKPVGMRDINQIHKVNLDVKFSIQASNISDS